MFIIYIYIPILDNVEIIYGRKLMSILYIYIYHGRNNGQYMVYCFSNYLHILYWPFMVSISYRNNSRYVVYGEESWPILDSLQQVLF